MDTGCSAFTTMKHLFLIISSTCTSLEQPTCLEELRLAEFAVCYENVSGSTWTEDDGDSELREQESEIVRKKAAVLRHR